MRIIITGATGFIGRYILDALMHHQDAELAVVGRHRPAAEYPVDFIETDLLKNDPLDWIKAYRPTHLLHLAWYAEHGQFWESPLNWDWCEATERLAEAFCKHGGKKLIMAGTCAEYDWSDGYCKENETLLEPATTYGRAKDQARRKVQQVCDEYGTTLAWGRIFYPFGEGEDSRRLIPSITDALLSRRDPFPINITHRRDFMPVQEVAVCFRFLANHEVSGIYNISSGTSVQIKVLIDRIGAILGKDPTPLLERGITDSSGQNFLAGDNTALKGTGWKAEYDTWSCLKKYVTDFAAS